MNDQETLMSVFIYLMWCIGGLVFYMLTLGHVMNWFKSKVGGWSSLCVIIYSALCGPVSLAVAVVAIAVGINNGLKDRPGHEGIIGVDGPDSINRDSKVP